MTDDAAHATIALEGLLAAGIFFAAVAFIVATPLPGETLEPATLQGQALAGDVLRVLAGRPGDDGYVTKLDEFTTKGLLGDTVDLRNYMDRTLPAGSGWGLYFENGVERRTLAERGRPTGEVYAEDLVFYPDWGDHAWSVATLYGHHAMDATDVLRTQTVLWRNSYVDLRAAAQLNFTNGHAEALALRGLGDGVRTSALVPPELPGAAAGYDSPYTLSDPTSFSNSITLTDPLLPRTYATTAAVEHDRIEDLVVPVATSADPTYAVHPQYPVDAALQDWLAAGGHVVPDRAEPEYAPGETVRIDYDLSGAPDPGWGAVTSREVRVRGPIADDVVAADALPGATGAWTWTIPDDALYGTYVVEVRSVYGGLAHAQTGTELALFHVLRPGTDGPAPPAYRVTLAVWFNALG